MAKRIGIDPTTLSRLEGNQGKRFCSTVEKVSLFLNRRTLP
ncbi:MAG: hypothetical protein HY089_02365 [Ignavibacteriales bacterium]|nr:hypothetical protein [Ignavibacteriales bacterium]